METNLPAITSPSAGTRAYIREIAHLARRAASAPDCELSERIDLLARQIPVIIAMRDVISSQRTAPKAVEAAR